MTKWVMDIIYTVVADTDMDEDRVRDALDILAGHGYRPIEGYAEGLTVKVDSHTVRSYGHLDEDVSE